jgi:hypothetical protein
MRTRRFLPICVVALMAMLASGALAKDAKKPGPPVNVRGFVLTPSEPPTNIFSRTPAFSWQPVRGALCYEFELSTAQGFNEASVIWSNVQYGVTTEKACSPVTADYADTTGKSPADSTKKASGSDATGATTGSAGTPAGTTADAAEVIPALKVPAVSVDISLPWFTGSPYALYARARAITQDGPTAWSKPFGFNMQWENVPLQVKTNPGLISWTPITGATAYEVMFQGPTFKKVITTATNVADQRDLWTFHDASWFQSVTWRVRAVRRVFGQIPNGLPAVTYGPWSQVYQSTNPPSLTAGDIKLTRAISDVVSVTEVAKAHQLMPAIAWTGTVGIDGQSHSLFRAYVSTDAACVNTVFRGSIVGSPAYAPRTSGPMVLPASDEEITAAATSILADGASESAETRAADASKVTSSEGVGNSGSESGTASASASPGAAAAAAKVDLPDVDFPSTRYYYTVVGVDVKIDPKSSAYKYVEAELPQDVCAAGRVLSFGKKSRPVQTSNPDPLVIGLSPTGTLLTAGVEKPVVYSTPLVTWTPALGATAYEVQWSRSSYPWKPAGRTITYATSSLLDLPAGKWFYRVRGLNAAQLRKSEMAWSRPTPVQVATPTFKVVKLVTAQKAPGAPKKKVSVAPNTTSSK